MKLAQEKKVTNWWNFWGNIKGAIPLCEKNNNKLTGEKLFTKIVPPEKISNANRSTKKEFKWQNFSQASHLCLISKDLGFYGTLSQIINSLILHLDISKTKTFLAVI